MDKKKSISANAFEGNATIVSVKFGSKCGSVGNYAFKDCISLEEINEDNEIETIGENAFCRTKLSTATFNRLNILYNSAFNRCSNLTYVNIPNNIEILNGTFMGCNNLTHIDIPQLSSTIGTEAFKDCNSLQSVNNSGKLPFEILTCAFYSCYNLNSIYFNECTKIEGEAFVDCRSLTELVLNKCESIGQSAFAGCTGISQITLSVCNMIEPYAFANCTNLSKVYINNPPSIFCTLSNKYTFCTHETSSVCHINNDITFYFRTDAFNAYKEDSNWKHYIDDMTITTQGDITICTKKQ